jgi:thioredoxin reductase
VSDYDVVIVGAGPAGLSAALMLGRCRRRVVVIDDAAPRNRAATATHGFLTRDGTPPSELLGLGRADLTKYKTVHLRSGTVISAAGVRGAFAARCSDGRTFKGRRLLIATGVVDRVPAISGIDKLYGRSVHHCPFCDAFEYAGQPLAQYGRGRPGVDAALILRGWTDDIVLLTDGRPLSPQQRARCARHRIPVREETVSRLLGRAGKLAQIEFASGPALRRAALFFATAQVQRSDLARSLGCEFTPDGAVMTNENETTNVPGVYVAGDASHRSQKVIVAAAEGALAAIKIHESLWKEDLHAAR